MIPERDYVIAKAELQRRRASAAADRLVRDARREAAAQSAALCDSNAPCDDQPRNALRWLRRLAGARG